MKRSAWIKLGGFCLLIIGVWWGLKAAGTDLANITPENVRNMVLSFGVWAPVMYLVVYGQPLVPLPASVVTLAGGLLFGVWWGWLAAVTGATIRACGQFGVARLLGRDAVAKLLKGRIARLDQAIGSNGFKAVLLIRLIPNFPYDMQNYGLGFSRVRFRPFAMATLLGLMPWSFAFVYFGDALTDPRHFWKVLLAIIVIVGLVLAQYAWKWRHPLPEETP